MLSYLVCFHEVQRVDFGALQGALVLEQCSHSLLHAVFKDKTENQIIVEPTEHTSV